MAVMILAVIGGLIPPAAQAQLQTASTVEPAFEVASVKISHETNWDTSGGPGTRSPGIYKSTGMTMRILLGRALGFRQEPDYQFRISGPSWIDHDRYDVFAKIPPDTSRSEFQRMLLSLLIERFKLVLHHKSEQLSAYQLIVDKNGLKMKESSEDPSAQADVGPPTGFDRDGFPRVPAGSVGMIRTLRIVDGIPRAYWTVRNSPISALVSALATPQAVQDLVIDKTGLTGRYNYTLGFEIDMHGSGPAGSGPTVFEAVREQLGLRLIHNKTDIDVVVVEHGERVPVEN